MTAPSRRASALWPSPPPAVPSMSRGSPDSAGPSVLRRGRLSAGARRRAAGDGDAHRQVALMSAWAQLTLPAMSSRGYVAGCLAELGRFTEGRVVGEEAVRTSEAGRAALQCCRCASCVGVLCRRQGDIHRAIPALERSLTLVQSTNISRLFPQIFSILGVAYALAGRAGEARPLLDHMLDYIVSGSRVLYHALVLTELSGPASRWPCGRQRICWPHASSNSPVPR